MRQKTIALLIVLWSNQSPLQLLADTTFCGHKLALDEQKKIIPWHAPTANAYDHFLRLRWNFIKTQVPDAPGPAPRSGYPQYYFYCAFRENNGVLEPDTWMNDVGEKIPNWFESARLYYAYTGDSSVMTIVKDFVDYTLEHGTSPSTFAWPHFPYTTANAGDTLFRGFTSANRLALHEIQVDHAGEMGLTYYRMYQYTREPKYLTAAIHVADVLARNAKTGTAAESVWPYRVVMDSGKVTAPYGANWTGCYMLLDKLIKAGIGNVSAYSVARDKAGQFILQYPMRTGYWTDGHTDTDVKSNTYKSNLSASNMTLCLFDTPDLDPDWRTGIPGLIKWTEDNFIFRGAPGEPSAMWGANIVGEQDSFIFKMDYQTARYAAECARWYAVSGDETYKEKAYRSLNWVTYCNDSSGMAFESPVSKGILSWWSDCYGECPRMFYHAFAGVPEWAPPAENHILYSEGILRNVDYSSDAVRYFAADENGTEFLRLAYEPLMVSLNGKPLARSDSLTSGAYTLRDLGNGDWSMAIQRSKTGDVVISGAEIAVPIDGSKCFQQMDGFGVNANTAGWNGKARLKPEPSGWYAGDMHVHRDCGGPVDGILPESKFIEMMQVNDLAVISVLADMGDGEVKDAGTDLPKVNGKDARQSIPGRIVHYDAEWHWDPAGTTFEHKALGGHIVLLGLSEAHPIWDESPYKILEYGRKQNGIVGFCHAQYLNDQIQNELNCCIPFDFPVEAALGATDFLSEDVYGARSPNNGNYSADAAIHAYYKLLNCGIRLGLAAGTDYPCNGGEPLGTLLTFVNVTGPLTYRKWVEGIRNGKTVVARNGHVEFVDLKVNGRYQPGDDIKIEDDGTVAVEVKWTSIKPLTGRIELVCNGKVIDTREGTAKPGEPVVLTTNREFSESGWLCARRMDEQGRQTHTAPVYVTVNDEPVRASAEDARYFVKWIDNLLENTAPGASWNQYFTHDLDGVQNRYRQARAVYKKIAQEAGKTQNP